MGHVRAYLIYKKKPQATLRPTNTHANNEDADACQFYWNVHPLQIRYFV